MHISHLPFSEFCNFVDGLPKKSFLGVDDRGRIYRLAKHEMVNSALHQKTWGVFLRSMQALCDRRHIELVCKRYNINLVEKVKDPLSKGLVRLFHYALQLPSDYHTPEQIEHITTLMNLRPSETKKCARWQEWGAFRVSPYVIEKALYRIVQSVLRKNCSFDSYVEHMTRSITNCRLQKGMWLPAHNGEWYRVTHTVYQKSLVAAVLEPVNPSSSLPALFLFRPSQYTWSEGAKWTTLDDIHPDIGSIGYGAAKEDIETIMQDLARKGRPVVGGGYSLGGVHLQLCAVDHPFAFSRLYLFASPSIAQKEAERFAKHMNAWRGYRLPHPVEIYSYRGFQGSLNGKPVVPPYQDVVCCMGSHHLGAGVQHPDCHVHLMHVHADAPKTLSYGDLHRMTLIDKGGSITAHKVATFQGRALQKQLNNGLRGQDVVWYERVRLRIGKVLKPLLHVIDKIATYVHNRWKVGPFKYQPTPHF